MFQFFFFFYLFFTKFCFISYICIPCFLIRLYLVFVTLYGVIWLYSDIFRFFFWTKVFVLLFLICRRCHWYNFPFHICDTSRGLFDLSDVTVCDSLHVNTLCCCCQYSNTSSVFFREHVYLHNRWQTVVAPDCAITRTVLTIALHLWVKLPVVHSTMKCGGRDRSRRPLMGPVPPMHRCHYQRYVCATNLLKWRWLAPRPCLLIGAKWIASWGNLARRNTPTLRRHTIYKHTHRPFRNKGRARSVALCATKEQRTCFLDDSDFQSKVQFCKFCRWN